MDDTAFEEKRQRVARMTQPCCAENTVRNTQCDDHWLIPLPEPRATGGLRGKVSVDNAREG